MLLATRGEGYGLPLVEAAASGLPITVTGWSGHMDFLDKKYCNYLNYKLDYIPKSKIDNRIFVEGTRWAEVDEVDFKKKILKIYKNNNTYKKFAKKLRYQVRKSFSRSAVIAKYNKFLKDLDENVQ
jgi:glycosyltransferase involved in cell wall biosynthesis